MSMAARIPGHTLPVTKATAKPPMAESRMLPSRDRLVIPAFSVSVSPRPAKTRGVEDARMEAMDWTTNGSLIRGLVLRLGAAAGRMREAPAQAAGDQEGQHHPGLQHPAE